MGYWIYRGRFRVPIAVNFWMPKEMKIRTITHRKMASKPYEPEPLSAT